jgi:Na+-driven multidrug efflux pump
MSVMKNQAQIMPAARFILAWSLLWCFVILALPLMIHASNAISHLSTPHQTHSYPNSHATDTDLPSILEIVKVFLFILVPSLLGSTIGYFMVRQMDSTKKQRRFLSLFWGCFWSLCFILCMFAPDPGFSKLPGAGGSTSLFDVMKIILALTVPCFIAPPIIGIAYLASFFPVLRTNLGP